MLVADLQTFIDTNKSELVFIIENTEHGIDSLNVHCSPEKRIEILTSLESKVKKLTSYIKKCDSPLYNYMVDRMDSLLQDGDQDSPINVVAIGPGVQKLTIDEPISTLIFGHLINLDIKQANGKELSDILLGIHEEYSTYDYNGKKELGIEKLGKLDKTKVSDAFLTNGKGFAKESNISRLKEEYSILFPKYPFQIRDTETRIENYKSETNFQSTRLNPRKDSYERQLESPSPFTKSPDPDWINKKITNMRF